MKQVLSVALMAVTALLVTGVAFAQEDSKQEDGETKVTEMVTPDVFRRAARNGDLETVKRGIEQNIDIDAPSAYGATALFFACDRGQAEVVDYLLEKGADPNIKDSFYNSTPVAWSVMQEHQDIALSLIKYGGEIESVLVDAVVGGDDAFASRIIELRPRETEALVKARDAALRITDDEQKTKMVALFASLELPDPVEVKFDQTTMESLVGKYSSDMISFEISIEESGLMITFEGGSPTEIIPSGEAAFKIGSGDATFEIEEGTIDSIDVTFGARTFNLKKVAEGESGKEAEDQPRFKVSSAESLAADASVSSSNWPGFRGVGSRGVAQGQKPPVNFHVAAKLDDEASEDDDDEEESEESAETAKQPRQNEMLLWETPVEGLGLSSPTIWEDKIFITTAVAEGDAGELKIGLFGDVDSVEETQPYEFKLLCYSKSTGEKLWQRVANKAIPAVKRHSKSSHANPTVATDGKHVVAFFGSEGLYCYSIAGERMWKRDLGYLDSGWFFDKDYQWGFASSPTIHNGRVYVQCDIQGVSFVECMDIETGEKVWRCERDEIPSWSTPVVHRFGNRTMLITNGTKSSRGYDANSGELLWSMKGNSEIVVPTPNVAHDLIFVSSGYAPIRPVYAIRPDASGDISIESGQSSNESVVWSEKNAGPYMPTPVVYGDYLYCCANAGIVTCFEAKTGQRVYKKRLQADGGPLAFTASPVAADGHVYFTAEDGRVLVIKTGPEFEIVATNHLNQSTLATPAISEGAMFFRTQSSLIAVGHRITD